MTSTAWRALIVLLILANLGGCGQSDNTDQKVVTQYESHLDQARFFQSQGQLKASMTEARHAIALAPELRDAYVVVAETLLLSGDADRAIKAYTELLTENPETASADLLDAARLGLASAYLLKGQLEEAQVYLDEIQSPTEEHTLQQYDLRIQIAMVESQLEEAGRLITEAEALAPNTMPFTLRRSQLSFYRGDSEGAIQLSRSQLEKDPDNSETWLWLAQLLVRENRLEEAEEAYRKALEEIGQIDVMTLRKYQTIEQFAGLLRLRGKSSEADTYQEVLNNSGPGQLRSRYLDALALYRSALYTEASDKLAEILQQAPEHREAGLLAGLVAYQRHNWKKAEELLSRYLSPLDPPETRAVLPRVKDRIRQNRALHALRKTLAPHAALDPSLSHSRLFERLSPCIREALPRIEAGIDNSQADQILASCNPPSASDQAAIAYLLGLGVLPQREIAIGHFRQALTLAPFFNLAFYQILHLEKEEGDWNDLFRYGLEGLPQFPNDPLLLSTLLLAAEEGNDVLTDMQALENTLQQHPQYLALKLLADFHLRIGNPDLAKGILSRARKFPDQAIDPDFTALDLRVITALAKNELTQNRPDEAYRYAEEAAHRYPDDIDALLLPVEIAYSNDQPLAAEQRSHVIKSRFPNSGKPEEVDGDYALRQGNFAEAEKHFHKAWLASPSFALAMKRRNALRSLDRPIEALAILREWLTLNPEDIQARKRLALDYTEQQMDTEAEYWYRSALAATPDDALILNNLAWIASRKNKRDETLTLARQAYLLEPENVAYIDTYIWMLYQNGQVTEALAALQEGLRRHPTSPDLRKRLKQIRQPPPTP